MDEFDMCAEFHKVMFDLPSLDIKNLDKLPAKGGLYVLYEKGEGGGHTPEGRRVVRVGINESNGTLANRIQTHYLGGSSSFRTHMARALFKIRGLNKAIPDFNVMDISSSNLTSRQNKELNAYFADNMYFRCMTVEAASERGEFEERAIATISNCSICQPSVDWLGHHSVNSNVRSSGLWNDEHTDSYKRLHQEDLERLRSLIQNQVKA